MANLFKLKTKANIPDSPTLVYTTGSGVTSTVILGMILTNKVNYEIAATVYLESNTSDVEVNENIELLHEVPIPQNTTLEIFSGQKLNLQTNDRLKVMSSANNTLDFALSMMEITA